MVMVANAQHGPTGGGPHQRRICVELVRLVRVVVVPVVRDRVVVVGVAAVRIVVLVEMRTVGDGVGATQSRDEAAVVVRAR